MNRILSIGRLGLLAAWAVAAATLSSAPAAITVQDGVPWVYTVNDGGATILHGPGCGDVTIPAQLDCYPVTGIGSNAFSGCTGLTGMTLPGSVTYIGSSAFSGCTGLETLCVPVGLAGTTQVADSGVPSSCTVLYGDAWEKVDGAAWSYVVHDGTATVTAGPREGTITIPSVLGGHPVTGIGSNAFYQCSGLTSVTIGDSVTSLGDYAFSGCSGLTSVTIPDSMTSIGSNAFRYCSGLTSVTIPDSVTSIGYYAFSSCSGLTSVTVQGNVTNDWTYNNGPFDNCWNIESIVLGERMTKIGNCMFYNCPRVQSLTIPDSVTSIGYGAFSYCEGLTSVTIGNSVTSIGRYAFTQCTNMTSVTIGNSVKSIGNNAFGDCYGLTAVYIHDLAAWCEIAFDDEFANPLYFADWPYSARHLYLDGEEVAGNLVIPDGVANIGIGAFYYCANLTSVTIPDSVTNIGGEAFYGCSGLTNVMIGNSVKSIGDFAFYDCSGLPNVTIPDSVSSIGDYAFGACSGLTNVMIPGSVTSIGSSAFNSCSSLRRVRIPDSVKSIGDYAFGACRGLTNMMVGGSVTNIGCGMVEGCSQLATMNVPKAWRSLYVNGEFWSDYARVPWGCTIVYYAPASPGVTATGVPYEWLEEKAGEALAVAGGDYEAAAKAAAANGRAVWECYVAGLDPGDAEKDFTTAISFADGVPEVSWNPDLNEGGTKSARSYVVEGKSAMADDWDATNSASRFFRVKVELPKP